VPPFTKNMKRTPAQARKRNRLLSDDEIRAVWRAAEAAGNAYGAFVRVALLTGQRCAKISTMRFADVSPDGVWSIPREAREKANATTLRLPRQALEIIKAQPRLAGNPHVFAGRVPCPLVVLSSGRRATPSCAEMAWVPQSAD